MAGHIVQPVDLVDGPTLHQAFLDHDVATAATLFSGLEDKHRPPVKIPRLRQILRGPQQDRGVPVMAAGMHLARRFGGILKPRRLGDGQSVHIRAQADTAPRGIGLALDHRDDAALRHAGGDIGDAKAA